MALTNFDLVTMCDHLYRMMEPSVSIIEPLALPLAPHHPGQPAVVDPMAITQMYRQLWCPMNTPHIAHTQVKSRHLKENIASTLASLAQY